MGSNLSLPLNDSNPENCSGNEGNNIQSVLCCYGLPKISLTLQQLRSKIIQTIEKLKEMKDKNIEFQNIFIILQHFEDNANIDRQQINDEFIHCAHHLNELPSTSLWDEITISNNKYCVDLIVLPNVQSFSNANNASALKPPPELEPGSIEHKLSPLTRNCQCFLRLKRLINCSEQNNNQTNVANRETLSSFCESANTNQNYNHNLKYNIDNKNNRISEIGCKRKFENQETNNDNGNVNTSDPQLSSFPNKRRKLNDNNVNQKKEYENNDDIHSLQLQIQLCSETKSLKTFGFVILCDCHLTNFDSLLF